MLCVAAAASGLRMKYAWWRAQVLSELHRRARSEPDIFDASSEDEASPESWAATHGPAMQQPEVVATDDSTKPAATTADQPPMDQLLGLLGLRSDADRANEARVVALCGPAGSGKADLLRQLQAVLSREMRLTACVALHCGESTPQQVCLQMVKQQPLLQSRHPPPASGPELAGMIRAMIGARREPVFQAGI